MVVVAHQTHRWVQGRISPQVEVAVVAAGVVGILTYRAAVAAAGVVAVVAAGVEARLRLQQLRVQSGLGTFDHCPMALDHA